MYNKKLWIIVIILLIAFIALIVFTSKNPNEPVTHILNSYMNQQQIDEYNSISSNCGFKTKKITRDESLDGLDGENTIGFRIETQYTLNVILYIQNGIVKSIRCADNYLYNDGNIISNISNYLK